MNFEYAGYAIKKSVTVFTFRFFVESGFYFTRSLE